MRGFRKGRPFRKPLSTARSLGLRTAELSALDDSGEVLQVLLEVPFRVGEDVRDGLAHGPAGWVGVVHRHLDPCAPWRGLLEADLATGHDLAVDRVPAYAAVRVHLGRLRVELHALAERTLDPPVTGVLGRHPDLFDVGHNVREVLEVGPVTEDVLERGLYLDTLIYSLCHKHPFCWLQDTSCP